MQIGLENQDNNCKITNCLFKNNYVSYNSESKGHAGVACLRRGVTFKYCNFTNNMACSYGVLGFHDGGSVINCKFYNNYAMESGGALGFDTSNQKINIVNSDFENNTAKNGGAIYLNSKGQIENCRFINNIATHCGGAIYSNSKISIITSNFTQNIANNGGAGYINEEANIFDSNFMENIAEYGGAIYSKSQLTVNDSLFKNNSALNGSAIYNNGMLNIYKSHFNSNKAKSYNITSTNNAPVKKGDYLIIKVKLLVGDNVLDAIYNNGNATVDKDKPIESNLAIKQEILLILNNETYIVKTNDDGIAEFIIDTTDLNAENYTYFFIHLDCELYTGINDNDTVEILENNQQPKTKKNNELLSSSNNNWESNPYKTKTKIHSNLKDYLKSKGYASVNDLIKDNTNKYPYHVDNNHHKLKNKYRNDKGFDDYLYNMWKINWPHEYNIDEFLKDGAYMNAPLLLGIGNLALPLLITSYYINGKIHEAKIKTNGDFWKTLNEPIIHFYGYKTHFADEKGGKALVDFLLGIDENGDMSIGNALINSISLLCGFKIGTMIPFRTTNTNKIFIHNDKLRTLLNYGEVIKEGLFDFFSIVSKPINVISVIVSRIGKTFFEGSSKLFDSFYSFFNNDVRNIFYFLNPANQQNAENNIKNLTLKKSSLSKIKDIAKRSVNKVKTFIKKINNKLHKVVKKVKTKLNKFFKNVKKIVKKVQNKVTNIVKNIKTTVKTVMKKVNKIIKKVKNTIKRVTKKVKTIVKQVKSNVKKIKKKTNKVIKNIKSTVKTIKNKTTHTLTKHVNKLVKKVKNNVKKIKTKTKRIIKKIKNNIQQVKTKAQKMVDNAKTKVQQFKKAVEHNYNLVKNKIKNGYQILKTKFQSGCN